jgi:MoxR-like ATPase
MMKIVMPWPERADEIGLAQRMFAGGAPEAVLESGRVGTVLREADLPALRGALDAVVVREEIIAYLVDVVRRTREHENILVGAGPRAMQALLLAGRALAAIEGRDFVTPDDVRAVALAVLDHRLILRPEAEIEGVRTSEVVDSILHEIPVPR